MTTYPIENIAGMSLGGGRRENFFLCLLEYFPEKKRWFLKSLHQVKDEEIRDRDEIIKTWAFEYNLKNLVVDFPLSTPPCEHCELICPGANLCPKSEVMHVRKEMDKLLREDLQFYQENPKKYEQERLKALEFDYSKNILDKKPHQHLLSKAFKRKLKKGFIPYWHRPIDFWIWCNYYDQLLEIFKNSYESYGQISIMLLARLKYLFRHLPKDLSMFESSIQIGLLELLRSKIISKSILYQLFDLDLVTQAREQIIQNIEKHLSIFIYEHDMDILVKNQQAFDSFLLAVIGKAGKLNKMNSHKIFEDNFIIPGFDLT